MYNPTLGRWMTEDPIDFAGDNVNFYGYVNNNPTNKVDPSGLHPPDPPYPINKHEKEFKQQQLEAAWKADAETFMSWYTAEMKDLSWLKNLDTPPDKLEFRNVKVKFCIAPPEPGMRYGQWEERIESQAVLPDGWEWDNKLAMSKYHPKATYGIRKKAAGSDAGQQAMYDGSGKLITGGLSAGTPDKYNQSKKLEHLYADVAPFDLATRLDTFYGGDKYRKLYLQARPPMKSSTAPENILD